jgi:hypothetical protein
MEMGAGTSVLPHSTTTPCTTTLFKEGDWLLLMQGNTAQRYCRALQSSKSKVSDMNWLGSRYINGLETTVGFLVMVS